MTHPEWPDLLAFYDRWKGEPLDHRTAALQAACDKGEGTWTVPTPPAVGWPASAQHEVFLHRIIGFGDTPEEAARSWFKAAQAVIPVVIVALSEATCHRAAA